MAIYVFNLLVGYFMGGVDYAQGSRSSYLKKLSVPVKYVYTDVPKEREISEYKRLGIDTKDMLSAHFFMSGNKEFGADIMTGKSFYSKQCLSVREYFADRLLYTDYYTFSDNGNVPKTQLVRRTFRRPDGISAYDMILDEHGQERYLFPNGEILSKQEFLSRFVQNLNLTEEDIILIDRPGNVDYVQPLFTYANGAKIVVFLHSGHYAQKRQSNSYLYLNYEYYYWFRNSDKINTFFVSTEWQAKDLAEKLEEYGCKIPRIEVIPVSGLEKLYFPTEKRQPGSLLTVSRFVKGKRIDWIIRSVIEAHKVNDAIHLDIYGEGDRQLVAELEQIVKDNKAESYIRFMGHQDVTEVYKEYEVYISASLWETLGLSLMEATGSGDAMLGLNVEYGNKVFIQDGQNGYTTDIDFDRINDEVYVETVIQNMAQNILKLFESPERMKAYQEKSYQIAENFLNTSVEEKWLKFFGKIIEE